MTHDGEGDVAHWDGAPTSPLPTLAEITPLAPREMWTDVEVYQDSL